MKGTICELIAAPWPRSRDVCRKIFGQKFQNMAGFNSFLRVHLCGGSVDSMFAASETQWSIASFQALFIACWVHHPTEKGTYMIDLGSLDEAARKRIEVAYQEKLPNRLLGMSSHLSKHGRSASPGWDFLKGYHELLVQLEDTKGHPYLMLKAEGHTTDWAQVVLHMASWGVKIATGRGATANKDLKAHANLSPVVEGRAAENYQPGYEQLVRALGLHGTLTTVRELMAVLFKKTRYLNMFTYQNYFDTASNAELGRVLKKYILDAKQHAKYRELADWTVNVFAGKAVSHIPEKLKVGMYQSSYVTDHMLNDLLAMADCLQRDGDVVLERTQTEVRVKPAKLDETLRYFLAQVDYEMPDYVVHLYGATQVFFP